ncbi:MAG: GAF and ANTAR domain-containing protein [Nocardioidaceae bacterium]|nr:GAF and ANTAR domain-containing protein [Nocardioidaceae bacterium]
MIPAEDVGALLVETADTAAEGCDTVGFLRTVAANVALISGAEAVGIRLDDGIGLSHVASSNQDGRLLELLQLALGEGPSLNCFKTGADVVETDLSSPAVPWVRFPEQALEAGFRSVHVLPMSLRGQTVGTVGIYGTGATALDDVELVVLRTMVDLATIRLLQDRETARARVLTDQLQAALTSRIVIEQAKGVIAAVHGVDIDRSFDLLRRGARARGLRLTDVAAAIVADPASAAGWSSTV